MSVPHHLHPSPQHTSCVCPIPDCDLPSSLHYLPSTLQVEQTSSVHVLADLPLTIAFCRAWVFPLEALQTFVLLS